MICGGKRDFYIIFTAKTQRPQRERGAGVVGQKAATEDRRYREMLFGRV